MCRRAATYRWRSTSHSLGIPILLSPGAEYVGAFHLTKKAAPGWIIITTDGVLPPPGQRATREWQGKFAKVMTRSGEAVFDTPSRSAAGYRLIGLEISRVPSAPIGLQLAVF